MICTTRLEKMAYLLHETVENSNIFSRFIQFRNSSFLIGIFGLFCDLKRRFVCKKA